MTALSVARDAALRIGVQPPDTLFGGSTRTLTEMQSLLNECAQSVAFDSGHDWTALRTLATLTGDGVAQSFPLPPDYRRMLKTTNLWLSSSPGAPLTHIVDADDWLRMQGQVGGAWTIIGGQIHVRSGQNAPLASGQTVQFYYLSSEPVLSAGMMPKAAFSEDTDMFRLDERVIRLALIYRWKQAHGQDYAEEMSDYGNALAELIGNDRGSNILAVGRSRVRSGATVAYPGTLGA